MLVLQSGEIIGRTITQQRIESIERNNDNVY